MKFTVANWHTRSAEYWLNQPYAYTIMVSPPDWAKACGMNQPLFAATASEVFGNISQEEYTQRFQAMLQERRELVNFFINAHSKVNAHVILLCACPGRTIHERFCHRYLVAEFLRSLGCEEVPLPAEESEPMEDIVVTVPLSFGLDTWIDEGDPAGEAWSGDELHLIHAGNSTAICGAVQYDQVAISRITARADGVCKRCVRVAQKKGLGLRYE